MRVSIVARPAPPAASGHLRWSVDIHTDGALIASEVSLQDPLDEKQKALCRWYFDRYRQVEPFSTTKAKAAVKLLDVYGASLRDQLDLCKRLAPGDEAVIDTRDGYADGDRGGDSVQQLYWEFLEDAKLWESQIPVRVQRLVPSTMERERPAKPPQAGDRVNILLVTARNLSRGWSSESDISPSLISNILWDIRDRLSKFSAGLQLNIEIARPGSFEAFQKHLALRSVAFDLVHLDMHGTVQRDELGVPTGYLHFADPHSSDTQAIPASAVAKVFASHGVSAVVTNACDSAQAAFGSHANTAEVLAGSGIANVLAMTHKASESATSIFMREFYSSILMKGKSFHESVRIARLALLSDPMRDARFHRRIPVTDWTIPTIYTMGHDWEPYAMSGIWNIHIPDAAVAEIDVSKDRLIGRDFDVLRLEKTLVTSDGLIHLYGPQCAGKTTLLRHLSSMWMKSGFVSSVVWIDFPEDSVPTAEDFANEALKQMGYQLLTESIHADNSSLLPSERLARASFTGKVVFILDGLANPTCGDRGQKQSFISDILSLIERLGTSTPSSGHPSESLTIISGRTDLATQDFSLGRHTKTYELRGLDRPDAIELALSVTGKEPPESSLSGKLKEASRRADAFVNLFEGLPGPLTQIPRWTKSEDLLDLYEKLQAGDLWADFEVNELYQMWPSLREFVSILGSLSDNCVGVWIALAWFWHQGPAESALCDALMEAKIIQDQSAWSEGLNELIRWGYIQRSESGRLSWIHPLFTLFMRIVAFSSSKRLVASSDTGWGRWAVRFAVDRTRNILPSNEVHFPWDTWPMAPLQRASRFMRVSLGTSVARDLDMGWASMVIPILQVMDKLCDPICSNILRQGLHYEGILEDCEHLKDNFMFALHICCGNGLFPLPHGMWPRTLILVMYVTLVRLFNSEQMVIVGKHFERLMHGSIRFSKLYGGGVVQKDDVPIVLRLASALADMHRRHIPGGNGRIAEFVQVGNSVLAASEERFGPITDPSGKMAISNFRLSNSFILLSERKAAEARNEFDQAAVIQKQLTELSDDVALGRFSDFLNRQNPTDARLWKSYMDGAEAEADQLEAVWNAARDEALGFDARTIGSSTRSKIVAETHPMTSALGYLARNYGQISGPASHWANYENEVDRGQWRQALAYHTKPILHSLGQLDYDQIHEHINQQIRIAEDHGVLDQEGPRLRDSKEATDQMQEMITGIVEGTVSKDQIQRTQAFFSNVTAAHGVNAGPLHKMMAIILKSWDKDRDPSLPHTSAPSVLALGSGGDMQMGIALFLRKHLSRAANSTEYAQELSEGLLAVLEAVQALEDAEDESSTEEIFRCLDVLETLGRQQDTGALISLGRVDERRDWNANRLIRVLLDDGQTLRIESFNIDIARTKLGKLERLMTLGRKEKDEKFKGMVTGVKKLLEECHLASICERAKALFLNNEEAAFLKEGKSMLTLIRQGTFIRALKSQAHSDSVKQILGEYFIMGIQNACDARKWHEAKALADDWRREPLARTAKMDTDKDIQWLTDLCDKMVYLNEFWTSLERLDFATAMERMQDFTKMEAKMAGNTRSSVVGDSLLENGEAVVADVVATLMRGGPVAAKRRVEWYMANVREGGGILPK